MIITQSDVRDMARHFFPHLTEAIGVAVVSALSSAPPRAICERADGGESSRHDRFRLRDVLQIEKRRHGYFGLGGFAIGCAVEKVGRGVLNILAGAAMIYDQGEHGFLN